ncbi:YIP1 family protein [Haloglomus irregulare]|jgi:hypothetical protein|uniref:YIP1 family protein n=1 Tax=Haloglomus irregulare TaxID=2234134 RepID=A0A554ND28_9EURY|nr:Yip1 family protein [Haloglomus irregulare]TSD15268.1 YIP1 family protein [Haloglomus irregulare]
MSPPRTPLLRPDSYFDDRTATLGRGLAVTALVTLATVTVVIGFGLVFAANIDGTVETSNPEYPGDVFCDGDTPSGCTEPATVEQDVDRVLWDAIGSVAGQTAIGIPIIVLVTAGGLHGGSALAGGEGGFGRSLAVAVWGLAPAVLAGALTVAALAVTFDPLTVSPEQSPETLRQPALAQVRDVELVGTMLGALATLWGAVIWRFGLLHQRGVSGDAATAVAGVVALLFVLSSVT